MGGGLLQLVSYGVADIHLTGNPQISFFKTVYQNHTNFVIETIEVQFEQHPNFGSKASITIPRQGDLISKMVLQFTTCNSVTNFCVSERVNLCMWS